MYLFIFESIGTQELILVGIVALIVFGPRKLPEMARKFGSMLTEFKKVSGDFRSTWENAVNLEDIESPKELDGKDASESIYEVENTIRQNDQFAKADKVNGYSNPPEIKELSKDEFDEMIARKSQNGENSNANEMQNIEKKTAISDEEETTKPEKTDWL